MLSFLGLELVSGVKLGRWVRNPNLGEGGGGGGYPFLPSQKHPPPLSADMPLEQAVRKTPGLEHPGRSASGGPVTLIIRVLLGGGIFPLKSPI